MSSSQSFLNMLCHPINCHSQAIQHLHNHLAEKVYPYHLVICDAPFGKGALYSGPLSSNWIRYQLSIDKSIHIFRGNANFLAIGIFTKGHSIFYLLPSPLRMAHFRDYCFGKGVWIFCSKKPIKFGLFGHFFKGWRQKLRVQIPAIFRNASLLPPSVFLEHSMKQSL